MKLNLLWYYIYKYTKYDKNIIQKLFKRFSKTLAQIEEIVLKFVEDEFIKTKTLQTDNYCLFEDLINPSSKEKLNKQKLKNKKLIHLLK